MKKNLENFHEILSVSKHSHSEVGFILVISLGPEGVGSFADRKGVGGHRPPAGGGGIGPPRQGPMIWLLSPIGGKSNELNSSHNTLYLSTE